MSPDAVPQTKGGVVCIARVSIIVDPPRKRATDSRLIRYAQLSARDRPTWPRRAWLQTSRLAISTRSRQPVDRHRAELVDGDGVVDGEADVPRSRGGRNFVQHWRDDSALGEGGELGSEMTKHKAASSSARSIGQTSPAEGVNAACPSRHQRSPRSRFAIRPLPGIRRQRQASASAQNCCDSKTSSAATTTSSRESPAAPNALETIAGGGGDVHRRHPGRHTLSISLSTAHYSAPVDPVGCRPAQGDRRRRIGIDPFDDSAIQPSSIDVRVDSLFRVFRNHTAAVIDVKRDMRDLAELVEIPADGVFMLHPASSCSVLRSSGSACPTTSSPHRGQDSLGRLGLLIHSNAGFVDPGWEGNITLELANVASLPITIYPGMKSADQLHGDDYARRAPYGRGATGSKYQGQRGPTPSRYFENFRRRTDDYRPIRRGVGNESLL